MKSKCILSIFFYCLTSINQTQAGIEEALRYLYGMMPQRLQSNRKPIDPTQLPPSKDAFITETDETRRQLFTDILNGKTIHPATTSTYKHKRLIPHDYALPDGTTPVRFAILLKRNHHVLQLIEEGYQLSPEDWQAAEFVYRKTGERLSHSDERLLSTLKKKVSEKYNLDDYPLIHRGGGIFDSPQAQLVKAAQTNDLDELRKLLINQVDPNSTFLGSSALELAVIHGHEIAVCELLAAGARANTFHITKAQCKLEILATCVSDYDGDPYPGSNVSANRTSCFEFDCKLFNRIIEQLKRNMQYQEELIQHNKNASKRSCPKTQDTNNLFKYVNKIIEHLKKQQSQ